MFFKDSSRLKNEDNQKDCKQWLKLTKFRKEELISAIQKASFLKVTLHTQYAFPIIDTTLETHLNPHANRDSYTHKNKYTRTQIQML